MATAFAVLIWLALLASYTVLFRRSASRNVQPGHVALVHLLPTALHGLSIMVGLGAGLALFLTRASPGFGFAAAIEGLALGSFLLRERQLWSRGPQSSRKP